LLVDLDTDGQARIATWPDGGLPEEVSRARLNWPLDGAALEDLRWYLEDYLLAPYGVWEDRGPAIRKKLADWGDLVFGSVFGAGPARDAYQRARDRGLEVVFRSAAPALLGLPWELMRDGTGPVAMGAGGISRSLPVADGAGTLEVPGGKLRVLMVISRPAGASDVGYQMVARPLLERLDAVRGEVSLTVLRPPTFDALRDTVRQAADAGEPFHVVHFDGHGAMLGRPTGGGSIAGRPAMMTNPGEGVLAFEKPGGGSDHIGASKVAAVLAEGKVPVVVLNACQSGAVGKELEASVATALLKAGCAAVVAMAYSVYAVAAAEFMAAFYESLFAGDSVGEAVTVGRKRLFDHDGRPSPKGDLPLADWVVPVHYLRKEVRFPQARTTRPAAAPSLDEALEQIRAAPSGSTAAQDPLAAVDGVFVGRDDLFYQLETAARLQRVVVLNGPGGTGKTELAKGFARWWRDTGGVDDPRLVFWHSFEPGIASFGLDGVINALGLEIFGADFARLDPPRRLDAVKRLLARYRVLLLWDNFETVLEMPDPTGATPPLDKTAGALLKGFLEWIRDHSSSAVLVTSRTQESWLGQVRRIGVGGLNRAEAAQYAGHLLEPFPAAQRHRERRSFGDLLDWLDGHPLAMRLILPRLDTTDPATVLSELRGTTPLSAADALDAHRTTSLAASISYSYAHLSDQTRRLLPAISLFHGLADENILMCFSAVEGVPERFAGISRDEWSSVLAEAARVGLLTALGGMCRIHPALPGYLAVSWHTENPTGYDRERQVSEQAFCAACAAFADLLNGEVAAGDAALAYLLIGRQRQTLGAMLGHALDHHAWANAEYIARALSAYWDASGLRTEAAAWADRILDATAVGPSQAPLEPAGSLWLYTIVEQANRQLEAGQPEQAAQAYRRALAYLQDLPATEWTSGNIAVLYHHIGMTAQDYGRLDEAEEWYRQSLAIGEELGNRLHMAGNYHELGRAAQTRGRLEEAEGWFRKSLAIEKELGDRPAMANTYHELGNTAYHRGQLDECDDWCRQAIQIRKELGLSALLATDYHLLGITAQAREWLDEAEEWYRKSLAINEELGIRTLIATTYHQLGTTAHARGRLDEAEEWFRQSLAIKEEFGDRPNIVVSYQGLGMTALARGRLDEAEKWYRKSLAVSEELANGPGTAHSYHQLGITAHARGRMDEAEEWFRQSLAIKEALSSLPDTAMTYGQLGLLAEARRQPRQALEWMVRCVALFDQFPHPATGPGHSHLARLTRQLGMPALDETWRQVTGQPLPQPIRDYVTGHQDVQPAGEP
jgi:tetratricopeptide (TPR) repeat protein